MENLFLSFSHSTLLHLESTGNKELLILNVHGGVGIEAPSYSYKPTFHASWRSQRHHSRLLPGEQWVWQGQYPRQQQAEVMEDDMEPLGSQPTKLGWLLTRQPCLHQLSAHRPP